MPERGPGFILEINIHMKRIPEQNQVSYRKKILQRYLAERKYLHYVTRFVNQKSIH
jgi:hypothetical protein